MKTTTPTIFNIVTMMLLLGAVAGVGGLLVEFLIKNSFEFLTKSVLALITESLLVYFGVLFGLLFLMSVVL